MQAWNLASPVAEPYREFADRWGNAEFSKYVDILEQQADEAMQDADQVHSFAEPLVFQTYVHSSNMLNCLEYRCNTGLQPATWHLFHQSCSMLNFRIHKSFMTLVQRPQSWIHGVSLLCNSGNSVADNPRCSCRRSRSQ